MLQNENKALREKCAGAGALKPVEADGTRQLVNNFERGWIAERLRLLHGGHCRQPQQRHHAATLPHL